MCPANRLPMAKNATRCRLLQCGCGMSPDHPRRHFQSEPYQSRNRTRGTSIPRTMQGASSSSIAILPFRSSPCSCCCLPLCQSRRHGCGEKRLRIQLQHTVLKHHRDTNHHTDRSPGGDTHIFASSKLDRVRSPAWPNNLHPLLFNMLR